MVAGLVRRSCIRSRERNDGPTERSVVDHAHPGAVVLGDHVRQEDLAPRSLRDEAPAAYKDIGAVMRAQRALTRVVRRLRPLLSFKAA